MQSRSALRPGGAGPGARPDHPPACTAPGHRGHPV